MNAAFIPTTPPPMIITLAAATPGTPPSRIPRPPSGFSCMKGPARGGGLPGTSDLALSRGGQRREPSARVLDLLVGDARRPRGHQAARQRRVRGEVQVGEQRVAGL